MTTRFCNKFTTLLLGTVITFIGASSVAQADLITWTGGTNNDWDTASNWDGGLLPSVGDDVVIGIGQTVAKSGDFDFPTGSLNSLTLGEGSDLSFAGGGDFRGDTWNIDGTVTMGAVSGAQVASTFNFGTNGSLVVNGPYWGNSRAMNLSGVIDLTSAPAGTLVTHELFSWTGNLNSSFGTITDSFTEANGLSLTQLADNTAPVNDGEYSFFLNAGSNGSLSVQYVTAVPEPSSALLFGLAGLGLFSRRRK